MDEVLEVRECKKPGFVMTPQGQLKQIPEGWSRLPPGDATMSRRIKKAGPCWIIKKRKGNKWISLGILADSKSIEAVRSEVVQEKQDPAYQKKLESSRKRREKAELMYVSEFEGTVRTYLSFAERYQSLEDRFVKAVVEHAVPVGSGTVARTKRIPIEQRAEAAVIAWMRHQTTAYDFMHIPLIKGKRREVRRRLADQSKKLLRSYREGRDVDLKQCPLARALLLE